MCYFRAGGMAVWFVLTMASPMVWAQQEPSPELKKSIQAAMERAHRRAHPTTTSQKSLSEQGVTLPASRLDAVLATVTHKARTHAPSSTDIETVDVEAAGPPTTKSDGTFPIPAPLSVEPGMLRANCGPILLQRVFSKYGIHLTLEALIEQSNTQKGMTSLYDMKRTVHAQAGLHAQGVRTHTKALAQWLQQGEVICHFTKNNHYILVQHIDDQRVQYIDPSWSDQEGATQTVWRDVFERQWEGVCLIISDKPLGLSHAEDAEAGGASQ